MTKTLIVLIMEELVIITIIKVITTLLLTARIAWRKKNQTKKQT